MENLMHCSAIDGYKVENYTKNDLESIERILESAVYSLKEKLKDNYLYEENLIVFDVLMVYMLSESDLPNLLDKWMETSIEYNKTIQRDSENKKARKLRDIFKKSIFKADNRPKASSNPDTGSKKIVEGILNSDEKDQWMQNIYRILVEEINKSKDSEENKKLKIEKLKKNLETIDLVILIHSISHKLTTKIKFLFTESQNEISELKIEGEGIRDFAQLKMRNCLMEVLKKSPNIKIVLLKNPEGNTLMVAQLNNRINTEIHKKMKEYVNTRCNCQFGSTDLHAKLITDINIKLENHPINPQTSHSENNISFSRRAFEENHNEPLTKTFSEKEKLAAHNKMQKIINYIDKRTNKSRDFCGISRFEDRVAIGCIDSKMHYDKHFPDQYNDCTRMRQTTISLLATESSEDKYFFIKAGIRYIYIYYIDDCDEKFICNIRLDGVNLILNFSRSNTVNYVTRTCGTIRCIPSRLGNVYLTGNLTIIGTVLLDSDYGDQDGESFYPDPTTCKIFVDGQIKITGNLIVEEGRNREIVMSIKTYSLLVEGSLIGNVDVNLIPAPKKLKNIRNAIFIEKKIGASGKKKDIPIKKAKHHSCAYIDTEGKPTIYLEEETLRDLIKNRTENQRIYTFSRLPGLGAVGECAYLKVEIQEGDYPHINPVTCDLLNVKDNEIRIKHTPPESSPNACLRFVKTVISYVSENFSSR